MKPSFPLRGVLAILLGLSACGNVVGIAFAYQQDHARLKLSQTTDPTAVKQILLAHGYPAPIVVSALKATILDRDIALRPGGTDVASRWRPIVRHPPDVEKIESDLASRESAELASLIRDIRGQFVERGLGYSDLSLDEEQRVRSAEARFGQEPPLQSEYVHGVAALLSQQKATDFLRLRAPAARIVQSWLRTVEVPQEAYNAIVDDAIATIAKTRTAAELDTALDGMVTRLHERMGDELFLQIAKNLDPLSFMADSFVAPSLSVHERVELFYRLHTALNNFKRLGAADTRQELYRYIVANIKALSKSKGAFDRSPLAARLLSTSGGQK